MTSRAVPHAVPAAGRAPSSGPRAHATAAPGDGAPLFTTGRFASSARVVELAPVEARP